MEGNNFVCPMDPEFRRELNFRFGSNMDLVACSVYGKRAQSYLYCCFATNLKAFLRSPFCIYFFRSPASQFCIIWFHIVIWDFKFYKNAFDLWTELKRVKDKSMQGAKPSPSQRWALSACDFMEKHLICVSFVVGCVVILCNLFTHLTL